MQYIISQEEYNDLQSTIAELSKKNEELENRLAFSRESLRQNIKEIQRLRSLIKDIAGTVQTMSDKAEPLKGSDFDIDEKPTWCESPTGTMVKCSNRALAYSYLKRGWRIVDHYEE